MNVTIENNGKCISWNQHGQIIKKSYAESLLGYEVLPDNSGIILLEPISEVGAENAVIYDLDGSERWRLPFPPNFGEGKIFDRVGISKGKLIVIGIIDGRDVKFEVDYNALQYVDFSAAR